MDVFAILLAGGKGTRMKSDLPKVLFPVLGRPMVEYPLNALQQAGITRFLVVVGYQAERVKAALAGRDAIEFVLQAEQKGTAHAVSMCAEKLREYATEPNTPVVVVAGDAAMMQAETISTMLADWQARPAACLLGTIVVENPFGLGRILRDAEGHFTGIVEEKDASPAQREIHEVNQSYYIFNVADLLDVLDAIQPNNAQGEYYITDAPGILLERGKEVRAIPVLKPIESVSVNTPEELARVESILRGL